MEAIPSDLVTRARTDPPLVDVDVVRGERVASSRTTSVDRFFLGGGSAIYVKRYRIPTLRDALRGMLRGTLFGMDKASREFMNLGRLARMGMPVPEPLAADRRRGRVFLAESMLVTAEIEGAIRVDLFLRGDPAPPPVKVDSLVLEAARLVRRLHGVGYTDGSLAPRNLLVRETTGGIELFKVDCAKGRFRMPPGRRALLDLARLDAGASALVSARQRLRFLREYLGGHLGPRGRRWIEALALARKQYEIWELPRLTDS
ncbi:MAG: lipopolysaccharide kinase InaA family protein [Planctomycetota bacterium]|jgi:tRNA A-37 threonylcarbamoyl transferase component Bud32